MNEKLEVKRKLSDAINKKEVTQIQSLLSNNLLWFSNDYKYMQECYDLAKKNTFIFAEHDEKKLNPNKNQWTQEYYYEILSDLVSNFSKARYEFLIEVAFYLSAEKDSATTLNAVVENKEKNTPVTKKIKPDNKPSVEVNPEKKSNHNANMVMIAGGLSVLAMILLILKKMIS